MITFPPAVCALRPGEPFWPGSPCPFGDPFRAWPDDTELPHLGVDLDQRLLPLPDLRELVAPKRPVPGVLYVRVDTFPCFNVGPPVKVPVLPGDAPRLGFFPGKVGLYPGDPLDSPLYPPNGVPEVLVLPFGPDTRQNFCDLHSDVLAIGDDVESPLTLRQRVQYSEHLPPLGSLVRSFGGPVACPHPRVIGGVPPACPGSDRGLPASPVSGNHYEGRPGCRLDPALGFPHLGTEGRLGPAVGHNPSIPQAVWEVSWAFRLMAQAWAFIDIVPPVSQGVFADRALPRFAPSEMSPVGGVDGVRHDGVEEGFGPVFFYLPSPG